MESLSFSADRASSHGRRPRFAAARIHHRRRILIRIAKSVATKAETLRFLRDAGYRVPRPLHFDVERWRADPEGTVEAILREFAEESALAVRSSCRREDGVDSSMAGAFRSVLDVPLSAGKIADAVAQVVASYGEGVVPGDQVLIQPMVLDVVMSGVVMTRDLEDGSPYYVVEYDDESGRTDSITGGTGAVSKTVHVFRQFRNSDFDSHRLLQVVRCARQLETTLGSNRLDIEFCLDRAGTVHVLQARPIGGSSRWSLDLEEDIVDKVSFVEEALEAWNAPREGIWGSRTILGVMPDWNPAEIIGIHPRPLASSFYRNLVTERVWGQARHSMGYRELPATELMLLLAGRPYIDVRASFNSFLPEGTREEEGTALVEAWLDRLERHPEFHDKVEFEIAQTVADPVLAETWNARYRDVLDADGFRRWSECLSAMTRRMVDPSQEGSLAAAMERVETLRRRQEARSPEFPKSPAALLARTETLLEEARALGTLPFSVVARHAFAAEAFLRGFVARGALLPEDAQAFRGGIRTVSSGFGEDCAKVRAGSLAPESFLARYGHLRPGTYDILSPRYADRPDAILGGAAPEAVPADLFLQPPVADIGRVLEEMGHGISGQDFLDYSRKAVAGRELAKFVFTRNLSDALECLALWGEAVGLSREELSWLSLDDILKSLVHPPLAPVREMFLPLVEQGRRIERVGQGLKLGYLIRSPRDVYVMPRHRSAPNFVGRRAVRSRVVHLDGRGLETTGLEGAVVCIRNADPGFDWLFTRGIAGIVTQFGGTNSHMAIRCNEYGIPAAIGCGEQLFETIRRAAYCELDAGGKSLKPMEGP